MKKKIFAVFLAVCLFFCTLFASYETAQAAPVAIPIGESLGIEILGLIFSIFMGGMAASGGTDSYTTDILDDEFYREELLKLGVTYFAEYDGWAGDGSMTILLSDGTVRKMTGQEFYDIYASTSAEKIDEIYANWKVLQGGGSTDPEDGPGNVLGYIITPEMFQATQDYISDVYSGAIEGLDFLSYAGLTVTHTLEARDGSGKTIDVDLVHYYYGKPDGNGTYMNALCVCDGTYADGTTGEFYVKYDAPSFKYLRNLQDSYAYYGSDSSYTAYYIHDKSFTNRTPGLNSIVEMYDTTTLEAVDPSTVTGVLNNSNYIISKEPMLFFTNLLCFGSRSDQYNYYYYDSANTHLIINRVKDYASYTPGIAESLSGLAGETLKPDAMVDVYNAIDSATDELQNSNTLSPETLNQAVTDAATSTLPDVVVDPAIIPTPTPEPEPEPEPDPDDDPDPEEDEDIKKYKRDLTMIFPFCIPFDFIYLLEVLDAEPVAPCFDFPVVVPALGIDMTVELDLTWMDDVMEIFRTGETVCFVILLMVGTRKFIKW